MIFFSSFYLKRKPEPRSQRKRRKPSTTGGKPTQRAVASKNDLAHFQQAAHQAKNTQMPLITIKASIQLG